MDLFILLQKKRDKYVLQLDFIVMFWFSSINILQKRQYNPRPNWGRGNYDVSGEGGGWLDDSIPTSLAKVQYYPSRCCNWILTVSIICHFGLQKIKITGQIVVYQTQDLNYSLEMILQSLKVKRRSMSGYRECIIAIPTKGLLGCGGC